MKSIGYYKFFGNVNDYSGRGNNANKSTNVTYKVGGLGQYVNFPYSTSQYVTLASDLFVNSETQYTVVVLFRVLGWDGTYRTTIVNDSTDSWGESYRLEVNNNSTPYVTNTFMSPTPSEILGFYSLPQITANVWHMVIWVWTKNSTIGAMLDGKYAQQATTWNNSITARTRTTFGGVKVGSTTYEKLNGDIGLVIAYGTRMSYGEMKDTYSYYKGFF